MEDSAGNWCLIESDPGVFSEMLKNFGVENVQVEEIYSLDAEQFRDLKPVYGLIFLFKWVKDENPQGSLVKDSRIQEMFFAKQVLFIFFYILYYTFTYNLSIFYIQVITNACATQAILSLLLNLDCPEVKLGNVLSNFRDFTKEFDPATKGLALSNSDEIRTVHNSFARQTVFEFDSRSAKEDDDVFHFVAYLPIKGRLYELDGLREGPLDHGAIPEGSDWIATVKPIIEARIAKYQAGEIHFNLMAVIQDKLSNYKKQLQQCLDNGNENGATEFSMKIMEEEELRKKWHKENVRRRHNYLPFIVELLKQLASSESLVNVYEKAKQKGIEMDKLKEAKKAAANK